MERNKKIINLLKVLQDNIDDINLIYKDTIKDPYIEAGFEYGKKYPYNEETLKLQNEKISEQERLIQIQVNKLYGRIFNFTQTYNSFKGLLIGIYPEKKRTIEKFYTEKNGFISREEMGNKLKHDPKKDLEYYSIIEKITVNEKNGMTYSINSPEKTWYYDYLNSVVICGNFFRDLKTFLENKIFTD